VNLLGPYTTKGSQVNSSVRTYVAAGVTVTVELPFSEVCMHMRVAGTVRPVRLQRATFGNGGEAPGCVAQILNDDGTPFSFPITTGEAGFFEDSNRFYTYLPE
jgi:hypothetical protein